jgi:ABC-2 type transport system permease protein
MSGLLLSLRRIRAVIEKELIEIVRDPVTLSVALLMPLVMLFLFGYAISLDVENMPFGVLDQDRSAESRELIESFENSGFFQSAKAYRSDDEVEHALKRGDVRIVLVVPPEFSRHLAFGPAAEAQLLVDGSYAGSAGLVMRYATQIALSFHAPAWNAVRIVARVWYNPDLRSAHYIVPGLIGVILMAIPPLLTALAMTREKESGSIQQIFASPLTSFEFVLGKLVPYGAIAVIQMVTILTVGFLWFAIPVAGSRVLLFAAATLYVVCTVSIGLLISTITRSQLAAMLFALQLTLMPAFLFSGFLFPLFTMPVLLQYYSKAFPAVYFVTLSRDVVMKGVGLSDVVAPLLVLAAYTLITFSVAALRLRKKVA